MIFQYKNTIYNFKTLDKDLGLVNPSDRRLPDGKTYRLGSKTSSLVSAGLRGHERQKSRGAADFADLSTIFLKRLPADVLGVSACTW